MCLVNGRSREAQGACELKGKGEQTDMAKGQAKGENANGGKTTKCIGMIRCIEMDNGGKVLGLARTLLVCKKCSSM